ncbi:hypothetical protein [uncultured Sunxiuqinia sp.]|uniref:hypothetical protein n=1 Tax=uncultured Sunxiuqinia sp. TaxID=1573825 RepID=UPI002AA6BC48|nr:hypothetical protein [uncultured Sunxiuqinia sp.]
MNFKYVYHLFVLLCCISNISCSNNSNDIGNPEEQTSNGPKVVNIINFIRLLEPRDANITEDVLYQTVVKQTEIMREYELGGTFLLQYDALLDSRYQKLLKSLPADSYEIGAWWEVPQPLVENAGMEWRGRYPWDWHADVGFSTGYTPEEREKLVDVYMADFKEIFGYYPKSVGSWFIDAHTLNYLYEKYGIIASCNCKDQIGTDGYNLWGGYWNQAYYPSKKNAYMPAQNEENQIPVPIFRMLGSDPVRQYDNGIGHTHQGVVSLEPVYPKSGGDSAWVNWYFYEFVNGECLEYAYTQTGQENSFIWSSVKKGFEIQMPLIARLRDQKKLKVETLAESGQWFKKNYQVTPATSVTVNNDLERSDVKTVWFNSRFYRANLLWDQGTLRFRDIHLFDENLQSKYLTEKVNSNECFFFTFPFVDGHVWSSSDEIAGLRLKALVDEAEVLLKGGTPMITSPQEGSLQVEWPLESIDGTFLMYFDEQKIDMRIKAKETIDWYWDLTTKNDAELPFLKISPSVVNCEFDEMNYVLNAKNGTFSKPNDQVVLRISPEDNKIILDMADRTVQ